MWCFVGKKIVKGNAFCNFFLQHGRSESGDIDLKPWSEGGKADQSDPAKGGGGGAVHRPAADPSRRSNARKGGRSEAALQKSTSP